MIDPTSIDRLRNRIPNCDFVNAIEELDSLASKLPFDTFHEPVAITEISDSGNNRIINLDARYLTSWCHHMAYSMRVRMRSIEPSIIRDLANGQALAAQILLRSHLEASAMAALCLENLMNADLDALSRLVPQTLFGTALFNKAKKDERIAEMLTYSEQRTITISKAIAALHRFAYSDNAVDNTSFGYGLLCEASHPNHRGTKSFAHVENVDPDGEYGWMITYSTEELAPEVFIERLVELLLFSMSTGYSTTELLRNMRLSDGDDGLNVHGVPEEVGEKIYFDILNRHTNHRTRRAASRSKPPHGL